jgi:hypothetical protein
MDLDHFWALLEPGKDDENPEESLWDRLQALSPAEIVAFQEHFDRLHAAAYRWDLWGAAYLLEGGCSDDGFTDFRYALIAKGRAVYEAALANPDSLAEVDIVSNEDFGYVAAQVYGGKTGGAPLPDRPYTGPHTPLGEDWDFDDAHEARQRLPQIVARAG